MPLIKADRVKETSTSTGATTFALAGAATGFQAFSSVCSVGDTFYYVIDSDSGSEWETGLGTYSATNTLTRTTVYASSNSGSIVTFSAGTKNVYISLTGRQIDTVSASPPASTGAPPLLESLAGAAHTALTASTEYNDIYWNLARTVQFSTGAVATQRAVRIAAPTYSFVGASTITDAATVQIDGAPVAGTNATITNSIALRVLTGQSAGRGLVIQGAASQSANLQEWRNSSGTILGFVNTSSLSFSKNVSTAESFGSGANASKSSSVAVGYNSASTGGFSCAVGSSSTASSGNATAVGTNSSASGASSTTLGAYATSSNSYSIAIGAASNASANRSICIGGNITNSVENSVKIGDTSNVLNAFYGTLQTYMPNATTIGSIIRGAASQTANLQEWQDSSGSVLSAILPNGAIQPATLADASAANNSIYYSSTQSKLVYKNSAGTVNVLY
jgi:hypothetical protein